MTLSADLDPADAVRAAATAYCEALHFAQADALERLCRADFAMRAPGGLAWDRATFVARVASRKAFDGAPGYDILAVDVCGAMAHVKLRVDVPPRRFEDYLGFVREGDDWRLSTKLFRVLDGPAMEA